MRLLSWSVRTCCIPHICIWLSDLLTVSPGHFSTADPKPWTLSPAAARWSTAAAVAWQTFAGLSLRCSRTHIPPTIKKTKPLLLSTARLFLSSFIPLCKQPGMRQCAPASAFGCRNSRHCYTWYTAPLALRHLPAPAEADEVLPAGSWPPLKNDVLI